MVSICCITYNHEPYIRDCLEGFLMQQTNFPFEVLIHDDASMDHTADIILEYEAKYPDIIKTVCEQENQYTKGISFVELFGFARAQGKYIALCEGDDFWTDPNKLQIQYDFMESHPDYSMCFHGAKSIVDKTGEVVDNFNHIEDRDYVGNEFLRSWAIPTASLFFRRMFVKNIPESKDFRAGDIVIWLSMANCGKIRAFSRKMSVYRITESGMVSSWGKENFRTRIPKDKKHVIALGKFFPMIATKERVKEKLLSIDYRYFLCFEEE